jgi:hypothetical protein
VKAKEEVEGAEKRSNYFCYVGGGVGMKSRRDMKEVLAAYNG